MYFDKKEVAKKMRISEDVLDKWENTGKITYSQLNKLAKIYKQAPYIFFNGNPPIKEKEITDFRTVKNKEIKKTPNIAFELRDAKIKREILLDIEEDDKDFIINKFKFKDYTLNKEECINLINEEFDMSNYKRKNYSLNDWISKIEEFGVLVFQFYGINPKELRGYAIYYDKLPIIGINHQESDNAKKFTLFYEFAHLLLKKEGLSNLSSYNGLDNIEVKCNEIAGEVLVPSNDIQIIVEENEITNFIDPKIIKKLSKNYKVSDEVIVRKFLKNGYITSSEYNHYKSELNKYIFPKNKKSSRNKKDNNSKTVDEEIIKENKHNNNIKLVSKCITKHGYYYVNSLIYAYKNDIITNLEFVRSLDISLDLIKLVIQKMNNDKGVNNYE